MLVPRKVFQLAKIADTTASRFALGGVRIERTADNKPLAVVTDGRRLLAVSWCEENPQHYPQPAGAAYSTSPREGFAAIIAAADCKTAAKLPGEKLKNKPIARDNVLLDETHHRPAILANGRDIVTNTDGRLPIIGTDLERTQSIDAVDIAGRYPRWRDYVPEYKPEKSLSICIDAKYLAETLQAMAAAVCDDQNRGVVLTIDAGEFGHEKPLMISAARVDGTAANAIIMPLSIDKQGTKPVPQWHPAEAGNEWSINRPQVAARTQAAAKIAEPAPEQSPEQSPEPAPVAAEQPPAPPAVTEPAPRETHNTPREQPPAAAAVAVRSRRQSTPRTPRQPRRESPRPAAVTPQASATPAAAPTFEPTADWRDNARRLSLLVNV